MTQIDGPINLIRVKGKINNKPKIFYFFMDLHIDIHKQTECRDVRSVNIRNYLVNTFDNLRKTDKKIDFFLEAFPDQSGFTSRRTEIYLNQLRNMFEKVFNFDFKKNKIIKSKEFPNVRLHYMDIRPYFTFKIGDPFGMLSEIASFVYSLVNTNIYPDDITRLKNGIDILNSQLKIIYDTCFGTHTKTSSVKIIREFPGQWINYEEEDATKTINYLINKIKNVYDNTNIKNKINVIMVDELSKMFDEYTKLYNQLHKYLDESIPRIKYSYYDKIKFEDNHTYFGFVSQSISDDIIKNTIEIFEKYRDIVANIYVFIMDLYFLRRSLDKEYVTNSVVYTGAYHSANYIRLLLKEFDFKITHAFYSDINDLNALNKKIISISDSHKVLGLFLPLKLHQCVDITNFPPHFE